MFAGARLHRKDGTHSHSLYIVILVDYWRARLSSPEIVRRVADCEQIWKLSIHPDEISHRPLIRPTSAWMIRNPIARFRQARFAIRYRKSVAGFRSCQLTAADPG